MTVDVGTLLDAVRRRERPLYGAPEEARWQAHRVEVISRALGVSLDPADHPPDHRPLVRSLLALLRHDPPHPLAGYLEASVTELRFAEDLREVHRLHRELCALYREEADRLKTALFGHVEAVDERALVDAGLDTSLAPDWPSIYDRM